MQKTILDRYINLAKKEFNENGNSFIFEKIVDKVFSQGTVMDIINFASQVSGLNRKIVETLLLNRNCTPEVCLEYAKKVKGADLKFIERRISYYKHLKPWQYLLELSTIQGADVSSIAKHIMGYDLTYETKFMIANTLIDNPRCNYTAFKPLIKEYYQQEFYTKQQPIISKDELMRKMKVLESCRLERKLLSKWEQERTDERYIENMIKRVRYKVENCRNDLKDYSQFSQ